MKLKIALSLLAVLLGIVSSATAEDPAKTPSEFVLSPELLELFRAEMQGLLGGVQSIAAALPMADWAGIAATSEQMRKSYVLEQQLNDAQRK